MITDGQMQVNIVKGLHLLNGLDVGPTRLQLRICGCQGLRDHGDVWCLAVGWVGVWWGGWGGGSGGDGGWGGPRSAGLGWAGLG
jgi:hypothetical protein